MSFEETLARHQAFWERRKADRPLLGINVGFFINQRFPRVMARLPQGRIGPHDIPIQAFLEDCDDLYRSHRNLGDYPFVSAAFVGVPWLEAIAGCPIWSSPTGLWAEACVTDWNNWQWPASVRENPWTVKLLELMRALIKHAGGRYGVAPTLMRGPADIVSAMRGATQFPLDLVDDPEAIVSALDHCAEIWTEIGRAQLELIPESGEGYVAGDAALRSWAPGKLVWLQEDAMSLMSPSLYRDLLLPVDRRLASEFPCTAYHLHGSALWAIDQVLALPGVDVVELNLEAAACDVEGTFAGWRKIQASKPLVIWRMYGEGFRPWLASVLAEIPWEGLSIQVSVSDAAEGERVSRVFSEATAEAQGIGCRA
jgi:hypothetical protein